MISLVFLEVDVEDAHMLHDRFSEASVVHKPLNGNNEVLMQCKDAEIISCFIYSKFDKAILDQLPHLRLLCTRSVGYDHIDLKECAARGIIVCNVPDYGSHVIAEHVFALLLGTLRHVYEADKRVESGEFDYHGLRGMSLRGKTIGIVGTGKIGRHVAYIAHGYGMHLLATDQCRTGALVDTLGLQYVSYKELLAQSNIITLHVPVTEKTHHMIDSKAIETMKDDVILVNTARGALIDSAALLQGLKDNKVGYALLDVLEHEKKSAKSEELINHPRVVTTPHIAFYADESMHNMYLDCFESIEQWTAGKKPAHVVYPQEVVCDLQGIAQS